MRVYGITLDKGRRRWKYYSRKRNEAPVKLKSPGGTDRERTSDVTEYSTRDEFIEREIIAALRDGYLFTDDPRLEYDIDAIADEVIDSEMCGLDVVFFERDGVDFWDVVANHAINDGDYRIVWEESEDGNWAIAHLMQWSGEDEKFNDIDSKKIRAAQYRAVNNNIHHYDVEAILEMRHGLNDVIVVSDL